MFDEEATIPTSSNSSVVDMRVNPIDPRAVVDFGNLDYLVINTGYVENMLSDDLVESLSEEPSYRQWNPNDRKEQFNPVPTSAMEILRTLGCIYMCGDGMYSDADDPVQFPRRGGVYPIDTNFEFVKYVTQLVNLGRYNDFEQPYGGISVFKCNHLLTAFKLTEVLMKIHFCDGFESEHLDNIELKHVNGKKILYLYYDTHA